MDPLTYSPDAVRIATGHPLAADEIFLAGIEAGMRELGRTADDDELREYAADWRVHYLAGQREERERWRKILEAPAAQLHPKAAIHLATNTDLDAKEALAALTLIAGSGRPN